MPEFPFIELATTVLATLMTIIGGGISSDLAVKVLGNFLRSKQKPTPQLLTATGTAIAQAHPGSSVAPSSPHPNVDKAKRHLEIRLAQAAELERSNRIFAEIFLWSARLLTFSQYIVGGVLTLSFVKQMFTPEILGSFGVIVFIASGLNQRFNPSVNAEIAETKAEQLEALIHDTEDKLISIDTTTNFANDDAKPLLELIKKVSSEIAKIKSLSKRRKQSARKH